MLRTTTMICLLFVVGCSTDKPVQRSAEAKSTKCDPAQEAAAADAGADSGASADCAPKAVEKGQEPEETQKEEVVEEDPKPVDIFAGVTAMTDDEAIAYTKSACAACHNSKDGAVRSFWEFDPDTVDKPTIVNSSLASRIYYSTFLRAKSIDVGKPQPMPPSKLAGDSLKTHIRFVAWLRNEAPVAVTQAQKDFGADSTGDGSTNIVINYKCKEPASFRVFLRRLTNDAFGREPTSEELKLASSSTDAPTTLADRKVLARRVFDDKGWNEEFQNYGLRKFAQKLSGSNAILPVENALSEDQARDLKEEFYQILRANYDKTSYKDILMGDTVRVSKNTASLYGCQPPASGWADCKMGTGRKTYFSSFSYLASKPTSFLRENNNYGRSALMYFFVRGDVFKPAFSQDSGAETVKALPACLKSEDYRGVNTGTSVAPFGSNAVPLEGNLCQTCHIDRQMATGSIVFRKFSPFGYVYGDQLAIDADPDFVAATAEGVVNNKGQTPTQVDKAFLESLLSGAEEGCIPGAGGKDVAIKDVSDLAQWMVGDGEILASGLARHIPRAISNLPTTNEEILFKLIKAYKSGGGMLKELFRAYFESETYSCKK